ncbi:unnamed protein product [Alternaria alternata]|uniref:Uncharacterized protein n=2 Tax=Alternaria alternata complex TaxID=187734 RepID=A0A4Q4MZY6_ALTAL|nr:hypothetical protein AA0117_g12626 [Alternaria alternata]RYN94328.1 hypothetical protein AA0119_g9178 [Alternaria tenuissima]RYO11217.1 hypothetical protein AA0121_g10042 [Alternaria tenuissima]
MSTSMYENRIVRPILVKQPSTVVLDLIQNTDDPVGIGVVESTGAEFCLHLWLKVAAAVGIGNQYLIANPRYGIELIYPASGIQGILFSLPYFIRMLTSKERSEQLNSENREDNLVQQPWKPAYSE